MDAAQKAAEALAELGLPEGARERLARIILAAVEYDALVAERDRLLREREESQAHRDRALAALAAQGGAWVPRAALDRDTP